MTEGGTERLGLVHCSAITAAFLLITNPNESGHMEPTDSVAARRTRWIFS